MRREVGARSRLLCAVMGGAAGILGAILAAWAVAGGQASAAGAAGQPPWWASQVLYQIYPRSFADSDGDGNGDLKGIIEHVDYLSSLGIGVVWLSPIYQSPWEDMGYDISDYKNVHPLFGTIQDIKDLIKATHSKGLRLLMDLVPNHTSDKHPWFVESRTGKEGDFKDFYVWKEPKGYNSSTPLPPNNWKSVFGGSAWTYVEERKEFYLHQFGSYQPDLDYTNPKVVQAMKDVMKFWLDLGIDGFRVDAVPFLVEDQDFRDEATKEGCTEDTFDCLVHERTQNLPGTYQVVHELDKMLQDEYPTRYLFLEVYAPVDKTMAYYGELSAPFNFQLIQKLTKTSTAQDLKNVVDTYMNSVPKGKPTNWVLGNHDNPRVGSRLGSDFIDAANMLILLLPGVGVTYQGEEIGMLDGQVKKEDVLDCCGRDPERTPFHWDTSTNAGFSKGGKTWLPVSPDYKEVNVEAEEGHEASHLGIYRSLSHLRNITSGLGQFQAEALNQGVFAFSRRGNKCGLYVLINLGESEETVDLTKSFQDLPESLEVYVTSQNFNRYKKGDKIEKKTPLELAPKSGLVLVTETLEGC